jgi:hypothetical protein
MNKIRVLDRIDLMINTLRDYLERNPHERVKSFKGGLYGIHEDWQEVDIDDIANHLVMVEDLFAHCPGCKQIGIDLRI